MCYSLLLIVNVFVIYFILMISFICNYRFYNETKISLYLCKRYSILVSEKNECEDGTHKCDVNAICEDTKYSYTCTCKSGYTGNGETCEGQCM